ncbi:hypothetical protein HHI36_004635 [Cryptolaemus montrouzieri]|uniref:SIAH-type domain-containing protein n=1 Tax=Cryptolaemus montrouzieri TaxID=559131 RepID=A0ABD2NSJ4_9CUCU
MFHKLKHLVPLRQLTSSFEEMASFLRELYNTIIKCSECQEHFFGTSIYTTKIGEYFTCGKCVAKKITERKTFFGARKTGIHLPCPSYHYGCGEVPPKEEMDEHKEDCAYGFTCCTRFSSCVDVFHYNDVEDHYKMKHPECIRKSASQNYIYTSRRSSVYEEGFVIMSAFGYRFKIIWRANLISCKLYYLRFNFGFVDCLERYSFMIKLDEVEEFPGFKNEFQYCPLGDEKELNGFKLFSKKKAVVLQFDDKIKLQHFLILKNFKDF